jgi:hypothetical protein
MPLIVEDKVSQSGADKDQRLTGVKGMTAL